MEFRAKNVDSSSCLSGGLIQAWMKMLCGNGVRNEDEMELEQYM